MKKRTLIQAIALGLALGSGASAMAQANWKPTKPINLIVPWAAGGSTDQITRIESRLALIRKAPVIDPVSATGRLKRGVLGISPALAQVLQERLLVP